MTTKARADFSNRVTRLTSQRDVAQLQRVRNAASLSVKYESEEGGAVIYSYAMPIAFVPYEGPLADLHIVLMNLDRRSATTSKDQVALAADFRREGMFVVGVSDKLLDVAMAQSWAMQLAEALAAEWRVLKPRHEGEEHPLARLRRMMAASDYGPELAVALDAVEAAGLMQFPKGWAP